MELVILNTGFEVIAVIDEYESLIWTDRYDSYGDFEIIFAMNIGLLEILKEDYYVLLKESEHCMIIENIAIDSDVETGDRMTVTGRSLESILERRIIWKQTVINGYLQNQVKYLLDICIMDPSNTDRKIENFIFKESSDSKITSLTTAHQYTGDNLYTVIKTLCEEKGIGFKIILNSDNKFEFSFYAGVDRSYSQTENPYIVFSPKFENLINSNYYSSKARLKNVTLVAGENEGLVRRTQVVYASTYVSGLNRRELFTDARDISSDTESGTLSINEYQSLLVARGIKKLTENSKIIAFEGAVETTRPFKYGEDFFIGDIIQIVNEYGNKGSAYISEIVISKNKDEQAVYPTFKTIGNND